jgi:predicted transcriptional regulator
MDINAKWIECTDHQNFMGSKDMILVVGKITLARIYKLSNSNTWGVYEVGGIKVGELKSMLHYFNSLKEAQEAVEIKLSVISVEENKHEY